MFFVGVVMGIVMLMLVCEVVVFSFIWLFCFIWKFFLMIWNWFVFGFVFLCFIIMFYIGNVWLLSVLVVGMLFVKIVFFLFLNVVRILFFYCLEGDVFEVLGWCVSL